MSNAQGKRPAGFPPQQAYPDDRAPYGQPEADPYAQHPQSGRPAGQGWPPQEPQPDWGQQGGQAGYPQGWDQQDPTTGRPAYRQPSYPTQQQPPQQQAGYPSYAPQDQGGYPEDGYRYPNEPGAVSEDPYSRPTLRRGDANSYAGQFDDYAPQPPEANPQGQPGYGGGHPQYQPEPQLRGPTYEDWQRAQEQASYSDQSQYPETGYSNGYGQEPAGYDPRGGWPEPSLGGANGSSDAYGEESYGQQGYPQQGWGQQQTDPYAQQPGAYQGDAYGQQGDPFGVEDPYAYPPQGGHYGGQLAPELAVAGQQIAATDEEDDDYEDDDAAPQGRSRLLMVVGALVGAVVIGGGLAYGYKSFVGGGESKISSRPPVVRGDGLASKARPSDPGGRKFENADSKVLKRISNQGRSAGDENGGPRRVSTMMIGRNGQVVNQGQAPLPSSEPPVNPVVSVPGLTVVDGFAGQRAAAEQHQRQLAAARGQKPIVVTPPKTAGSSLSPVRSASVKKTTPPVSVQVPKTQPRQKVARAAPTTKTRPSAPTTRKTSPPIAPSSSGGKGYVAVLASLPVSGSSRLDALKRFADIQQNYGTVLANRTPDVREANLGSKGRYHRLMVGPPSSKESAAQLCKQLKSAGYPSCWITTY